MPMAVALLHKGADCFQHLVRWLQKAACSSSLQHPEAACLRKAQRKQLVSKVAADNLQGSIMVTALTFAQHHSTVRRTQKTVGAGNHLKGVFRLLLARMMHQQKANIILIGKFLQLSCTAVIAGVITFFVLSAAYFLQGVNDYQAYVRILLHKGVQLLLQTVINILRTDCHMQVFCDLHIKHAHKTLLQAGKLIL